MAKVNTCEHLKINAIEDRLSRHSAGLFRDASRCSDGKQSDAEGE